LDIMAEQMAHRPVRQKKEKNRVVPRIRPQVQKKSRRKKQRPSKKAKTEHIFKQQNLFFAQKPVKKIKEEPKDNEDLYGFFLF